MREASFLQASDRVRTTLEHHGEEKFLRGNLLSGAVLPELTATENLFSVAESKRSAP